MIDKPSLLDTPNLINGKEYTVSPVPGASVDDCYAKDSLIRGDYSVDYAPDWDEGKLVQETLPAAEWDAWMHDLTGFGWQVTEVLRSIWEEIYCIINGAQAGMAQQAITQLISGAQTLTNKTISFDDNTLTNVASLDTAQTLTNKIIAFGSNTLTDVASTNTTQTLTGKTLNLDLDTNKIYVGTANRVLVSDANKKIVPSSADTTDTEIGYVHGVTSAIQTQINGKQATITGAATSITGSNLTASKVLISNASGKVAVGSIASDKVVGTDSTQTLTNKTITLGTANRALITNGSKNIAVSSVTSTELGYVSGVKSAIQTQINKITGSSTRVAIANPNAGYWGTSTRMWYVLQGGMCTVTFWPLDVLSAALGGTGLILCQGMPKATTDCGMYLFNATNAHAHFIFINNGSTTIGVNTASNGPTGQQFGSFTYPVDMSTL